MILKDQLASFCKPMVFATAALSLGSANAATWDAGSGANKNWNSATNWTDDANPAGKAIVFGASNTTTRSSANSIVSENITVDSLTYQNLGAGASAWHVTEISDGATLTVSGGANPFVVGQTADSTKVTNIAIQGGGTFSINQAGGTISLGNSSGGGVDNTTLIDLSNLAEWRVNLGAGSFSMGITERNITTLILAKSNVIQAGTLKVGGDLGKNSGATLKFDLSVPGEKSIKIRGADGESSAVTSFEIADYNGGGTSGKQVAIVDFSGGVVDALVTTLRIGMNSKPSNANGYATGEFTMDRGSFVVDAVHAGGGGVGAGGDTAPGGTGTVNVKGGSFTANSLILSSRQATVKANGTLDVSGSAAVTVGSGGITMGLATSATAVAVGNATVNVTGGTLTLQGNIAKGSTPVAAVTTATLNLEGGTLDMGGHNIGVDVFTAKSGVLMNLGQFNSGANLVKTTAGTLIISGSNTYTGQTLVQNGALLLNGKLTHSNVTVSSGASLGGKNGSVAGSITLESGSSFSFTLDGSSDYGHLSAGSIVLGANANLDLALNFDPVPNQSFTLLTGALSGEFATINGAAIVDNQFTLLFGSESYAFNLVYGAGNSVSIAVVPEPGAFALAGVASALLVAGYRRRRSLR